jgi:hypothetical protein
MCASACAAACGCAGESVASADTQLLRHTAAARRELDAPAAVAGLLHAKALPLRTFYQEGYSTSCLHALDGLAG